MTKSDACTFVPAAGNASTRMTMSCTAPPAHRMLGCSAKTDLALDETADDVMRDGDRRRRGQSLLVPSSQHAHQFVLAKPASAFEFLCIHLYLAAQRFGIA